MLTGSSFLLNFRLGRPAAQTLGRYWQKHSRNKKHMRVLNISTIVLLFVTTIPVSIYGQQTEINEIKFNLELNNDRIPPVMGITFGGNYTFQPEFPGQPEAPPSWMINGEVLHGIADTYQYLHQGLIKGFVDSTTYNRVNGDINPDLFIDEWVRGIISIAIGEDENGNPILAVDSKATGTFEDEEPLYFEPDEVHFEGTVFETMNVVAPVSFEYFDGVAIQTYKGQARIDYLISEGPESIQLFFKKQPFGTWEVSGQTFEVALINYSNSPSYHFTDGSALLIDLDGNGIFDIRPDGNEYYSVLEPFNIANQAWEVTDVSLDGSSVTIQASDEHVDPRLALRRGTEAPDFNIRTLDDTEISLSDFKGKFVLLNFWGSWCPPCIEAIPGLKEAKETFASEDFQIVGIAHENREESAISFIERHEITWPNVVKLMGNQSDVIDSYRVQVYPSYYLLDREGVIVEYGLALSPDRLIETLSNYLGQ